MQSSTAENAPIYGNQSVRINWFLRKKHLRVYIKSGCCTYLHPVLNDPETLLNLFFLLLIKLLYIFNFY